MSSFPPFYAPLQDPETVQRLWQTKGTERATDIIAGRCIETAKDINAWRLLGRRGENRWQASNF